MIDEVLKELKEKVKKIEEKKNYFRTKPTICVAGVVSAGKSKFLNFLLDTDIFESKIGETTKEILEVGISKERKVEKVKTLEGHSDGVVSVSFSPGGKLLASGSWDETIKIWEVGSWKLVETLEGHSDSVYSVSFSPDGKLLASGSGDNTIKIWEVGSWKLVKTLEGHSYSVYSVSFSPDGKLLASGSGDKTIKIWEVGSWKLIKTLEGHSYEVISVSFSPDGKFLASGSNDETIKIWEVGSWKLVKTLEGHTNWVWPVSFSPDGKYLASGGGDKTIKMWEVGSWKLIKTLEGHSNVVNPVSFSPDGKFLASGSYKEINIWKINIWKRDSSEKMLEKLPPHAIRFLEFVNVVDIPGYDGTLDEKVSNYLKEGNYNIVLYILDVSKGLTKMDNEFLKIISERNPYILFIINKIDIYEGEEKSDFEKLISFVKEKVEEFYPKDRILGYVLTSVKKFRNDKKFIEFFQNTLIIASYISTFETNLIIAKNYLYENFEEAMNKEIKNRHRDYSNWYLKALKNGLYEISNMDIIMNGEKSIKNLIEELNSELEYVISQDVEKIGDFFNGKIKEVVDFINNMSISYSEILSLNLESSISGRISSVSVETPHLGSVDFSGAFNEVLVKIIGSIVSGILARLALGALIPGIGTIVFIGSLLWTIIDADNKANEIRSKVYNEVASNLPKIMREEWMKICAQIEKEYKKQVDLIINSKGIKKFLNDLIKSTYKMNDKISKFIIEEFI